MKELSLHILKKSLSYLLVILITAIIMFNCKGCENKTEPTLQTEMFKKDTITPKIKKNKEDIVVLVDSFMVYKNQLLKANKKVNYFRKLYTSTYDSLYLISDSINKIRLSITNEIKQRQDSSHEAENHYNLTLVANAENQIIKYQENELFFTQKIRSDSAEKKQLYDRFVLTNKQHSDDSLLIIKLGKKAKRNFKVGFVLGNITGATLGVTLKR
jgi:hypothetical protein